MRVLIACEFSGVVRDAFRAHGHDAISCDLLSSDRPGPHIQGDLLDILDDGWDLMIAHPPCTYLCAASNGNLHKSGYNLAEKRGAAADFFMTLINAPIPKIAIENPIGCMSSLYRKPDQVLRANMFGHEYRKDICLWLKNLPHLIPTKLMWPPYKKLDFWSTNRNPGGRSLKSITFQGVADAMAEQWGGQSPSGNGQ
jgi:hypothetical protein